MTLVHLRRAHHLFPIRPYLPALVEALEDTDGAVRECARQSVVELFTGPGVTDAARADLKKEMTKKGVRKGIVDGVLAKVLAGGGGGASTPGTLSEAGSENGDAGPKEYVPPSIALMNRRPGQSAGTLTTGAAGALPRAVSQGSVKDMARPSSRAAVVSPPLAESVGAGGGSAPDVKPVYIASTHDLENEFASMLRHFEGKETEHNWAPREQSIQRVRGMLKGEVHERFADAFLLGLKNGFINASLKTLASLRTTVATNTCSLYVELAITLGHAFDPFCDVLLTQLLRMASLTKKITAQQSQATFVTIVSHTSAQPRLVVPQLWNSLQDKSIQMRSFVVGHIQTYLEVHCAHSKHAIEAAGGAETLEKCIKKALGDPNAGVRENARRVFWVFDGVWPDRGRTILDSLDSVAKKQLEKVCPNPEALVAAPIATPKPKKTSVAAAIAASRAKAKAIATAPPTLRHQATSTSHAARAMSPTRRAVSPVLSSSSSMGAVRASSPVGRSSPPRARIVSSTMSRSVSSNAVPSTRSPGLSPPASPPSPTPTADAAYRRRVSSPLVARSTSPTGNGHSTFRRAMQTALPASPPSSVVAFGTPTPRNPRAGMAAAVPLPRESLSIAALQGVHGSEEESLLLATKIPIPEDSDSDMDIDDSVNLISFSTPFEMYPPAKGTRSQAPSFSPQSSTSRPGMSNALSTSTSSPPSGVPQPIVEDALRARAEQAESAAERLLELVEPDEDGMQPSLIPPSLLLRNGGGSPGGKASAASMVTPSAARTTLAAPRTPVNRQAAIMRRAALFEDSPAPSKKLGTLFDMVRGESVNAGEWWRKRTALISSAAPASTDDPAHELGQAISALHAGHADVPALSRLALLSLRHPIDDVPTPFALAPSPPIHSHLPSDTELWTGQKAFDRLLTALVQFLDPQKDCETLEYGLIVLWELLANQAALVEGREAEIFTALLQVRYSARTSIMQATNMFRDALTSRIEPVYGLTTLHACLRSFRDSPSPSPSSVEIKDGTYAFGLVALGKFVLRLPPEVLEEELPRLRTTLISALTDSSTTSSLVVREAAAASIIAAQLVLRDETHLFALLDGLPDDKKNLLTYLFDKHGSRGNAEVTGLTGMEKLEREMRRLDNRTSTPPRT
ncbi:uncharacterized protein FIBRA_04959 [Fibroporia radiculosa]|uniref:TOG domain-containing protein n=1 Tax=Fibroporia radiculosa TaxID=599839 RepID=J4HWU0_9APHY|nr:uncharacterized protein FIBRA_04959 [Fibroporia radiculosa]CCM02847.1 predicted protein [Fibroporia radiculosa]